MKKWIDFLTDRPHDEYESLRAEFLQDAILLDPGERVCSREDSEKCDRLDSAIDDYRRRMRAASSSLRSIPGDRDPNVSDAIALLTDAPEWQGEKA